MSLFLPPDLERPASQDHVRNPALLRAALTNESVSRREWPGGALDVCPGSGHMLLEKTRVPGVCHWKGRHITEQRSSR